MKSFDPSCELCPRIVSQLRVIKSKHPEYHAAPVPAFGSDNPLLMIVGLAPGMHGANATGRPFTGDYAGILLYETLYKYGFSNQPQATGKNDGLVLNDCYITNAVKCLPPGNKPNGQEIKQCNGYLEYEIRKINGNCIILVLGRIAHNAVLKALKLKQSDYTFGHNVCHGLADNRWLLDSYHCSRYNTQTRRLTETMFHDIFSNIHDILNVTK